MFGLKNDICLWIVPPQSGKVQKFRFTVRFALVMGLCVCLMGLTFLYVTGDYTRVQVERFKNYITLKSLMSEREGLVSKTDQLNLQVKDLSDVNAQAKEKEKKVREKLDALAQILKSVPFKGVITTPDSKLVAKGKSSGVGGAEVDCDGSKGKECSDMLSGISLPLPGLNPGGKTAPEEADLEQVLDLYIATLHTIPFGPPVNADVNSGFGYRISPFEARIKMHEGVDFALQSGAPIHCTADGVVKRVEHDGTYGLMVDVEHSDHIFTRYAHMSGVAVVLGQKILRGQVLGFAGSTGRSTGPHLHYEVRIDGEPKDPERFIALAGKLSSALQLG